MDPVVFPEEGGPATVVVTGTVTTQGLSRGVPTAVSLTVAGGTATPGVDYEVTSLEPLTIAAIAQTGTETFTLTPVNDDLDEGDGETVLLTGTSDIRVSVAGDSAATSTVMTIADDDVVGVTVRVGSVATTTVAVTEADAPVTEPYEVVLDSQPTAAVTVTPSVTGSADVSVSAEALTFEPGSWDAPQPVTVTVAPDADFAPDEATVSHAVAGGDYAGFEAPEVTVQVADDEVRSTRVMLTVSVEEVPEDGQPVEVVVTGTLDDGAAASAVVVTVWLDGTAVEGTDYTVSPATVLDLIGGPVTSPGALTIAQDALSAGLTFTLTPVDGTDPEGHRALGVNGSATGLTVTGTEVTILDDERSVSLVLSHAEVEEDGRPVAVTVTATRNVLLTEATEVSLAVEDGTATRSDDYTATDPGTLIIAAGAVTGTATFTLTPAQDSVDEGDGETLRVTGKSNVPVVASTPASTVVTILDDDTRGVTVNGGTATSTFTVYETDEAVEVEYEVVLATRPTEAVTVTPVVTGSGDVTASASLTFDPGAFVPAQTVTLTVAPDLDPVADEAAVSHEVAGGDYEGFEATGVTLAVVDDELPSTTVALEVTPESVNENGPARIVVVTATLDDGARAEATEVTVSVDSGTATEGTDFATVASFNLTIPEDTLSGTASFTIEPTDDELAEATETVQVTGTVTQDLTVTGAEVTIVDDDPGGAADRRAGVGGRGRGGRGR